MTPAPSDLLAMLRALPSAADEAGLAGLHALEAAYRMCLLVLLESCLEDGIDVDPAELGIDCGVVDDL